MIHQKVTNQVDQIQRELYQQMTPEKKLEIFWQLYYSVRNLKKAAIEYQHPDWSELQIMEELRKIFNYART